jgi:hypothetical protein
MRSLLRGMLRGMRPLLRGMLRGMRPLLPGVAVVAPRECCGSAEGGYGPRCEDRGDLPAWLKPLHARLLVFRPA